MLRRLEPWMIALAAALVAFLPLLPGLGAGGDRPGTARDWLSVALVLLAGLVLVGWRRHPLATLLVGMGAVVLGNLLPYEPSAAVVLLLATYGFVAGDRFGGQAAWAAGIGAAAWVEALYIVSGESDPAMWVFTVPGFVAGTVFRLRREAAEQLAIRAQELEEERELFAAVSVRNERARVAAELHDLIGHALSVMVVQSAAGQRLVDRDPDGAAAALEAIAASARQGREDLRRLVELLDGQQVAAPDLSLIDELVTRAARSGLAVTCRFEGDRDGTPTAQAHAAFRVVQEALTNALRHAPGAAVRVAVTGTGRALEVRVENDPPGRSATGITGSGSGLPGLRDRLEDLGGALEAGPTPTGGWLVAARLPQPVSR